MDTQCRKIWLYLVRRSSNKSRRRVSDHLLDAIRTMRTTFKYEMQTKSNKKQKKNKRNEKIFFVFFFRCAFLFFTQAKAFYYSCVFGIYDVRYTLLSLFAWYLCSCFFFFFFFQLVLSLSLSLVLLQRILHVLVFFQYLNNKQTQHKNINCTVEWHMIIIFIRK